MPSNFKVSSDIDTLLRKSTKEEAAAFLGLEDTKAQWGQITGTLTTQTDLVSALALKAPIASPTFTGTVETPELIVGSSGGDRLEVDLSGSTIRFAGKDSAGTGVGNFLTAHVNGTPSDNIGIDAALGTLTLNADAGVTVFDDITLKDTATFESTVEFEDTTEFKDDITVSNGGITLDDTGLEITSSSGELTVGTSGMTIKEDSIEHSSQIAIKLASDERNLKDLNGATVLDFASKTGAKFGESDAKLGIRKTPTAALDVGGTIKADSLNVNAKVFYVDGTDDYIQAEKYGEGTFAAITGSENQPKTTPAFGNNGKVVEKTFIKTLKLQGTGFTGLGTPVQIVPAAGTGKYNVPLEMTVFNDYGTRAGEWGSQGSQASIQIGTFQNSDNTGNFAPFLTLPVSTAENTGDWLSHKTFRNIESKQFANRDIVLKGLNYPSSEANSPDGEWYIRVEYMVIGESAGFENNVDQTVGTAF